MHGRIEQQRYFVRDAPRQKGKTSALYVTMRHYNVSTPLRALHVDIGPAPADREQADKLK